ncbi:MAG: hypothetical protein DRO67_03360 [Candidatus Asgardarchaeum californiense]|nr:MAG: hypothetical protein DRO67_03360 [Candidatus Asgardarchaeum californiense]
MSSDETTTVNEKRKHDKTVGIISVIVGILLITPILYLVMPRPDVTVIFIVLLVLTIAVMLLLGYLGK